MSFFGGGRSTTQFVFAYPVLRVTMSVSGSVFGHSLVRNVPIMSWIMDLGSGPSFGMVTGMLVVATILSCPCATIAIYEV